MKKIIKGVAVVFLFLFLMNATAQAGMQEDRWVFIQKLIKKGIFHKVEVPAKLPHLWVTSVFHSLDFDTKQQFVNVVYAYYVTMNASYNIIVLYDSKTGKEVGQYSKTYGGLRLQ